MLALLTPRSPSTARFLHCAPSYPQCAIQLHCTAPSRHNVLLCPCARNYISGLTCAISRVAPAAQAVAAQRVDLAQAAVFGLQRNGYSAEPIIKQAVRDILGMDRPAAKHDGSGDGRDSSATDCDGHSAGHDSSAAIDACGTGLLQLPDVARALALQQCAFADGDLRQGCDEGLQLLRLGCFMIDCTRHASASNMFILQHSHS